MNDPRVGTLLDGRYEVGRRLAHGGTAAVHLGHDQRLDRPVALKLMHAQFSHDPKFVERAQREARSAARLHHPNVVSVLDQGHTADGTLYLVLEYVNGPTLRAVITQEAPMSPRRSLELLVPILRGLAQAHKQGLVHRDVKPENVLLTQDGQVKVADFGLMRAVDEHTDTTTVMGTVGYAAPELVNALNVDQRTDVYSVGIMAYEMLTGSRPYTGTALQVAHSHVSRDVPAPSQTVDGIPPGMDELVLRATARSVSQRPPDAAALLDSALAIQRTLPPEIDPQATEVLSAPERTSTRETSRSQTEDSATQLQRDPDDLSRSKQLGNSHATQVMPAAHPILPALDQETTASVALPATSSGSSTAHSPTTPTVRLNPQWSAVQIALVAIGFVLLLTIAGFLGWVIGGLPVAGGDSATLEQSMGLVTSAPHAVGQLLG